MSEKIYDGGPAFPQGSLDAKDAYRQITAAACCGMSLRDYFAAKAMQGFCILPEKTTLDPVKCAADSYALADAMLKAKAGAR